MSTMGSVMRTRSVVIALLAAVAVHGCASVHYAPYEARNTLFEGKGGSKIVHDGIDFWTDGDPPRRFRVLGTAIGEVGDGLGAREAIWSAIASKAKEVGGNAAIEISTGSSHAGYVPIGGVMIAASTRSTKFVIVRYVE